MHRFTHVIIPFSAVILCDKHIYTNRKPHKYIDQQIDQRAGRAHCRKGLTACISSDNDHIRRVEQKLKDAGQHQRY